MWEQSDFNSKSAPGFSVCHFSETPYTHRANGVHAALQALVAAQCEVGLRATVNGSSLRDTLHVHSVGPLALVRILLHRGPCITSAHMTSGALLQSVRGGPIVRAFVPPYLRMFYNRADLVIAVSYANFDELRSMGITSPIRIVYNGLTPPESGHTYQRRNAARSKLGIESSSTVVLTVGQLQIRKGIQVFVECARRLPKLHFVWIGGFPYWLISRGRAAVLEEIRKAPSNVSFIGVAESNILEEYRYAADVFISLSNHENFGIAALEAASAGLPMVLKRLAIFEELYGVDDNSCFLIDTTEELVEKLSFLAMHASARLEMGRAAFAVASKFTSARMAREMYEAYVALQLHHPKAGGLHLKRQLRQ